MHRVVVVGHPDGVRALVRETEQVPGDGLVAVGACVPGSAMPVGLPYLGVPLLGHLENIAEVATSARADAVAVAACPELDGSALNRLAWLLGDRGVDLLIAPALIAVTGPRIHIRPFSGLPLLHIEGPELTGGRRLVKSAIDRSVAAIGLIILAPILLGLALAVRLTSSGPVMFRQVRVGRGGDNFTLWKFRTMCVGAEAELANLAALNQRNEGPLFKIREDPRVTRLGRWMRRYSLDELPQLVNVVTGTMSLVGPRPPLPFEVASYGDDVWRRLLVKPGLTGLWQISGRSDLAWEDAVKLDLKYVQNWSLALDATILLRTLSAVLRGDGAY
jgi:exopolysaccharide biosynthesis polyprenyl glycosylphosphotransferase